MAADRAGLAAALVAAVAPARNGVSRRLSGGRESLGALCWELSPHLGQEARCVDVVLPPGRASGCVILSQSELFLVIMRLGSGSQAVHSQLLLALPLSRVKLAGLLRGFTVVVVGA